MARAAKRVPLLTPDDFWCTLDMSGLPALVRCVADIAEVSLSEWEDAYPDDRRPHQAIAAARAWADDPCEAKEVAATKAAAASFEAFAWSGRGESSAAAAAHAALVAGASGIPEVFAYAVYGYAIEADADGDREQAYYEVFNRYAVQAELDACDRDAAAHEAPRAAEGQP